jgi:hypothetical protein
MESKVLTLRLGTQINQNMIDAIDSLGENERVHYWRKNDDGSLDLIKEV